MDANWNDQMPTSNGIDHKTQIELCGPALPEPLSTINCNKENDWNGGNHLMNIEDKMDTVDDKKVDCAGPVKVGQVAAMEVDFSLTTENYEIKAISKQRWEQLSSSEYDSAQKGAKEQPVAKLQAKSKKGKRIVPQQSNAQKSEERERADCKVMSGSVRRNNGATLPLIPKFPNRVSTLYELNRLRLSRYQLALLVHSPIFEETVLKCFVRLCIGNHKSIPIYRIAEIIGVVELPKKEYVLRTKSTKIWLRLGQGRDEVIYPIKNVSNQNFTKYEFGQWQKSCAAGGVRMPQLKFIRQKLIDIKKALHYESNKKIIECMPQSTKNQSATLKDLEENMECLSLCDMPKFNVDSHGL